MEKRKSTKGFTLFLDLRLRKKNRGITTFLWVLRVRIRGEGLGLGLGLGTSPGHTALSRNFSTFCRVDISLVDNFHLSTFTLSIKCRSTFWFRKKCL